jgi:hypothetical protein
LRGNQLPAAPKENTDSLINNNNNNLIKNNTNNLRPNQLPWSPKKQLNINMILAAAGS